MDPKLLLVKLITLLFKENKMDFPTTSVELAREVLQSIKLPEGGADFDRSRDSVVALRTTVSWMCDQSGTEKYDLANFLQRIRVNVGEDEGAYLAIKDGIESTEDQDQLKRDTLRLSIELRGHLNQQKVKEIIKKASTDLMFHEEDIDWKTFVIDIAAKIEPFTQTGHDEKPPGLVDEFDISKTNELAELMERAADQISLAGVIRVPWQGLERMFGDNRGIRRGETIVLGALQHNHKSGVAMGIARGACVYNSPWMLDPKKKPLVLYISLEDDLTKNVLQLYKSLKEIETGEFCDIRAWLELTGDERKAKQIEAAEYIHTRMSATGYHFKMMRFNPSEFDFRAYFNLINKLEAEGFEIHLTVMDYLNMMSKRGCDEGPTGANVRDLWRRMRNFHTARSIAFVSPHQLSTEAKALVRGGIEDFVKEIANKGYYDSCRTLDQEVDMEIYIHIVKVGGRSYLTVQRGKHRTVNETPDKDRYVVLPFSDIGGLVDDIHGADTSMTRAGADLMGGGGSPDGAGAWWL